MKRPALLRAFVVNGLPNGNLLISLKPHALQAAAKFYLLLRFFRGLLRQVMQSILAAISSSTLAEKGYHALFRRQWDGWSSET